VWAGLGGAGDRVSAKTIERGVDPFTVAGVALNDARGDACDDAVIWDCASDDRAGGDDDVSPDGGAGEDDGAGA